MPVLDRVFLRRLPAEEKTRGGLVIPDTAKDKVLRGQVLAMGRGVFCPKMPCQCTVHGDPFPCESCSQTGYKPGIWPLDLRIGDVVLFAPHGADETEVPGWCDACDGDGRERTRALGLEGEARIHGQSHPAKVTVDMVGAEGSCKPCNGTGYGKVLIKAYYELDAVEPSVLECGFRCRACKQTWIVQVDDDERGELAKAARDFRNHGAEVHSRSHTDPNCVTIIGQCRVPYEGLPLWTPEDAAVPNSYKPATP